MAMAKPIINIPAGTKVLVVEDNEIRNKWFRSHVPSVDIKIAETVRIAQLYLERNEFDMVFLDHDAVPGFVDPLTNGKPNPHYSELTFWKIAEELTSMNFPGVIVVHSGNPSGAGRMAAMLRRRQDGSTFVYPFGSFDIRYGV